MATVRHTLLRTFPLVSAVALAMAGSAASAQDPPLSGAERQRFVGLYSVAAPGSGQRAASLRVYEGDGALMGRINANDPTRLLYQGNGAFRPEQAPTFLVTFTVENGRATRVSMRSPEGTMEGARVEEAANASPDPSTSGALYDELARMDSTLFDAAYVTCDTAKLDALMMDDVEFYHDRTGLESGAQLRQSFQRLTQSCPHGQGITREVVAGSMHVYPIANYGAVQTGEHRFVERGVATMTVARFVHVWRRQGDVWKVARILSFDHQSVPR
jgi:ketosteroid isomerase-like protein